VCSSDLGYCSHCGEQFQLHTYKKKKEIKEYFRPKWQNNTVLSDKVVKWFEGRGISQFTLRQMKVTEGEEWMPQVNKKVNTVQFNYFRNGELINTKFRDGAKNFKLVKDAEKILYNLDSCHLSKEIIIVEGEMDALSYVEAGMYNVVSIPNGSTKGNVNLDYIDNCIEYFENKDKVYLALDNDEAGINTQNELIRRFGSKMCYTVNLADCKDANEYLMKYGNLKLRETISVAKEIPIDGISSVGDWQEEFEEYLVNGMKKGFQMGLQGFDNIFSTYTGQYIVVTGKPSSGKSDFVDMMCMGYMRKYGWSVAYASPENKPNKIHAGKLIAKLCGQWINDPKQIVSDWYKKAVSYMNDKIKYIDLKDSYDLELVLEKAQQMIFKHGIKVLVLDPYNKVRLKGSLNKNINEYTNDYLLMFDTFCRKNDILGILVMHPKKLEKQTEFDFYDIKGGGEVADMTPHILLVDRDFEAQMTKIKVLKVKFAHLGENGAHIWLKWNELNGRYIDYSNQQKEALNTSLPMYDNTNWISETEPIQPLMPFGVSYEMPQNTNFYETETNTNPFGQVADSESDCPF
jgi:twinkle protein